MNSSVAISRESEIEVAEIPQSANAPAGIDALFVMSSLHVGGTERKIVRVANRLAALGRKTAIAYLSGPETLLDMLSPAVERRGLGRRGRFSIGAARRLAAMINELRPRVVVSVNLYPGLYVLTAARWLCAYKPTIAALVNITDMGRERRSQQRFYQRLLPRFDLVVYGCSAQRDAWVRRESSAWSRSTVLYNGVDLGEFTNHLQSAAVAELRMKYGFGQQAFVIGTLGRLYRPKNQRVLIDAVARLRAEGVDARAILAGDGPDREYLKDYAVGLKVGEFVVMTGNITDVRPVLAAMDVFVLPSETETFSNAALEAMAMRRPVVLSDVGGAREMIRHGVDGYLIPHDDLSAQLPRILGDLAADRAKRAALGKAARERVERQFTFDDMIHQYDQIVRGAVKPRDPGTGIVVQVGPGLSVRGGVSTVERLIAEHVGQLINVQHVSSTEDGSPWLKIRVFLQGIRKLRAMLASERPLVVHMHFASRGSTLRKTVLAWMTLRARRPLVLHAHGASFDEFFLRLPKFVQGLLTRTFSRADRFVVLSSQWRDFYVRQCGLPEDRIEVLINPTSLPTSLPDRSHRDVVQFVSVGRIGARKGSFDLVRAFRALPPEMRARARLVFAGDGQVEELRDEARDLGDRVTVHSWLDRRQLDELLAASDVFVLPSHSEGVPMALLEAMAHGLPAIVTPVGGIPDAMTGNVEGLFVSPGDYDALSAAMRRMIEDETQRLAFGRAARARAEQFDVTNYAQQLLQIYQQLLGQSAATRSP